jgi:hypothetical protein
LATDTRANFWAVLRADSSQAVREFGKVSKATGDVSKSTSSLEGRFGSTMKKLAVATGVGFGVGAIVNFGKTAVQAASRLEQSMGATEAVFRGNTAELNTWAEGAADAMGLSEAAARESLSLIGAQLKNFGFGVEEAMSKGQGLVQLGADLAATFGGTTVDAVSAITAALRGERDPIERLGVSINETSVKAKALEMNLYDGTGTISQNAKASATLALIYEQTSDAAGQFAREADTVAGANARAAAKAENAAASIGEALAPAYAQAVQLAAKLSEAVIYLAGSDQKAAEGLATYLDVANAADATNGDLIDSFGKMVHEIDKSRSVGEKAGNAWNAAWGGLTDFNSDSEALRNLDRMREAFQNLASTDPRQAQRLLDTIRDLKVAAEDGDDAAQKWLDTYALGSDEIAELDDALMGARLGQGAFAEETVTATLAAEAHFDALGDLNAQYEGLDNPIGDVNDELAELTGYLKGLDDLSKGLDIEQAFIDLKKEADEAWYAAAAGEEDAHEELIDYRQALIDTQQEVAEYLTEVLKLPPERVTEILAQIDEGSISTAEGILRAIAASRHVKLYVTPIVNSAVQPPPGSSYWDYNANGGIAEGWSMVGERGPELVNFSQPGRVYTANETGRMMGGGGAITVTVNTVTADSSVARTIADLVTKAVDKDGYRASWTGAR